MTVRKLGKILLILVFFGSLIACNSSDKKNLEKKSQSYTLISAPITTNLLYSGLIQPLKTTVITSPAEGIIQEMSFHYGDTVQANTLLFVISSEKFQNDYKNALMQYIKSKNDFNTSRTQLQESEFLYKHELISKDDFKLKQSAYYTAQLSLVLAKDTLNALLKQLSVHGFKMDELKIENIDKINQALHGENGQENAQTLRVRAPVSGVVLLPTKTENETELKKIGKGDLIKQGDVLAVIGDTTGFIIHVNVNEFNINQLKIGYPVSVTSTAFPDVILSGKIIGIDRQAQTSSAGLPFFPVEIMVPTITPEQQKIIHIGMSATVQIDIKSEPQIMVPIVAVFENKGHHFVNVKNTKTGKLQAVLVKTGQTTADSVVIESTLKPGDKIIYGETHS